MVELTEFPKGLDMGLKERCRGKFLGLAIFGDGEEWEGAVGCLLSVFWGYSGQCLSL